MSTRLVTILWIIALALGGGVFFVKRSQNVPEKQIAQRKAGATLIEKFPAADVAAITLSGTEGTVHLAKKDGKWTVAERDSYPANVQSVNELLRAIADVEVVGAVEGAADYATRFGIDPKAAKSEDRGLELTFADSSGAELAKVSLGKSIGGGEPNPMNPMAGGGATGRFIFNHGDKTAVYKTKEMFSAVSSDPKSWLAQEFVQPEKIQSVSVTAPGKEEAAWTISRETEEGEFKLADAKPEDAFDASTTAAYKTLLSGVSFDDVVPAADVEKRAQKDQKRTATVKTVEGFTYTFTVTPAKAAEAKPAEEGMPPSESYFLSFDVSATLPTERKKAADEKPEDAKAMDEAFATRHKALTEKLAREQALKGRIFEVRQYAVEPLLKGRDGFKKQAPPAGGQGGPQGGLPPGLTLPPGISLPPGASPGGAPVEAVTPPIEVPAGGQ